MKTGIIAKCDYKVYYSAVKSAYDTNPKSGNGKIGYYNLDIQKSGVFVRAEGLFVRIADFIGSDKQIGVYYVKQEKPKAVKNGGVVNIEIREAPRLAEHELVVSNEKFSVSPSRITLDIGKKPLEIPEANGFQISSDDLLCVYPEAKKDGVASFFADRGKLDIYYKITNFCAYHKQLPIDESLSFMFMLGYKDIPTGLDLHGTLNCSISDGILVATCAGDMGIAIRVNTSPTDLRHLGYGISAEAAEFKASDITMAIKQLRPFMLDGVAECTKTTIAIALTSESSAVVHRFNPLNPSSDHPIADCANCARVDIPAKVHPKFVGKVVAIDSDYLKRIQKTGSIKVMCSPEEEYYPGALKRFTTFISVSGLEDGITAFMSPENIKFWPSHESI